MKCEILYYIEHYNHLRRNAVCCHYRHRFFWPMIGNYLSQNVTNALITNVFLILILSVARFSSIIIIFRYYFVDGLLEVRQQPATKLTLQWTLRVSISGF